MWSLAKNHSVAIVCYSGKIGSPYHTLSFRAPTAYQTTLPGLSRQQTKKYNTHSSTTRKTTTTTRQILNQTQHHHISAYYTEHRITVIQHSKKNRKAKIEPGSIDTYLILHHFRVCATHSLQISTCSLGNTRSYLKVHLVDAAHCSL